MDKKFYKGIAKKYGVSEEEVIRDIQATINETYKNPNAAALNVPRKGEVPTIDEIVAYAVKQIRRG